MIVGIDLGTSNSLVSVWQEGRSVLIPNALGEFLTPSVVGFADTGEILVGRAARERLVTHPEKTAAAFKRYMGTDRRILIGRREFRVEELSALVLRSLKSDAEAFLGEAVHDAIITVPAYFNDAQRKATKAAGQLAGLKVERLLTEPTAAALAYGFAGVDEEQVILVVDLGGGTLDVSLLHSFEGIMEVKATAGDIWLGGEDFVDAIARAFRRDMGKQRSIPKPSESAKFEGMLRNQCERAKHKLSEVTDAEIVVLLGEETLSWPITRDTFELLSESLLVRLRTPIERAIRDARIPPESISRIVFAGGATRMPMFRRLISRLFRQFPLQHISPDEVVARGAATRAGMVERGQGLEEHVMTDVSPFTLGVEVASRHGEGMVVDGLFLPIIERNAVIPTSRSHVLVTLQNYQTVLDLKIYQGESRFVRDNVFLGGLKLSVPSAPAGQEKVDVRFTYDTSGLLEVDATALSTKTRESLVIEGNPGVLSPEQIKARLASLAALKIHPRDEAQNIAIFERGKRLYEEHLGTPRAAIGAALDAFSAVLERQNPQEIAEARKKFEEFLRRFDDRVFS